MKKVIMSNDAEIAFAISIILRPIFVVNKTKMEIPNANIVLLI